MSHDSIGFDSGATDEIKVFRDEGEEIEIENRNQINEIKSSLITEQQGKSSSSPFTSKSSGQSSSSHLANGSRTLEGPSPFGKFDALGSYSPFAYPLPEYHQMANKVASMVGASQSSSLPFMMQQPPPAHMRNLQNFAEKAWVELAGLRNLYQNLGQPSAQYPLSDAYAQHFSQWPNAVYPLQNPAAFRTPYHPSLPTGAFPGFGRSPLMPHAPLSGHSFSPASFLSGHNSPAPSGTSLTNGSSSSGATSKSSTSASRKQHLTGSIKQEPLDDPNNNNSVRSLANSPSSSSVSSLKHRNTTDSVHVPPSKKLKTSNGEPKSTSHHSADPNNNHSHHNHTKQSNQNLSHASNSHNNQPHVKKPLNAFMIYMKEMRPKVIEESTLKESAAINQILGKRWHNLTREQQEVYYEKAKKERELHMELHPGWSAKDNYAINAKKKKKKRERPVDGDRGIFKKCRARFGLEQQSAWCKPCKRKKKCIRYIEAMRQRAAAAAAAAANGESLPESLRGDSMDDNLGSVGSVDAPTPDSKGSNSDSEQENIGSSVDVSLSSPAQSDTYHHLFNSFPSHFSNPMSSHLTSAASLFYPPPPTSACSSISSPLSSRMSSLLTPHSPLTAFSSSSSLMPPLQAPLTPGQSAPPRNSPFSIEQLARPHRQNSSDRSPPPQMTFPGVNAKFLEAKSLHKSANAISVITQMPTPPSSTDSSGSSSSATMLSVA